MATNWQASGTVLHPTPIGDEGCDPGGRIPEAATTAADTTLVTRDGTEKCPPNKIRKAEQGREVGAHHPQSHFSSCARCTTTTEAAQPPPLPAWKKRNTIVVIAVVGVAVVGVVPLMVVAVTCLLRKTCGNSPATNTATMSTAKIRIRAPMSDGRGGRQAKRIADSARSLFPLDCGLRQRFLPAKTH